MCKFLGIKMSRPIEHSNAQSNNWHCSIETLEGVNFKLFDYTIPMISIGTNRIGNTSERQLVVPGDHIDVDQLQLNFFVEESWKNYIEIYLWMRQCLNTNDPYRRDITIALLDNQKRYQGIAFVYKGCFPINIAPVTLDSSTDNTDLLMGASFEVEDIEILDTSNWVNKT